MKDNSPESTTPTLLDVQIAFEHWRTHRSSQREPTPEHLRQLAIGLLNEYCASKIQKALGLGAAALKQWSTPAQPPTHSSRGFVLLPHEQPKTKQQAGVDIIELPNGVRVTLSGQLSLSQVLQVASELRVLP
jgi:hypothetical protein